MILAIDIGNSTTTIGLYNDSGILTFRSSLETDKHNTKDQCAIHLLGVFQLYGADIKSVSGSIIASVVPPVTAALAGAIKMLTGTPPMIVGPGIKTGLNIKTDAHNQLGSDMVASSVAAMHKYPSPIIFIDMGTATTMSVLNGNNYEGCVIIPGVRIALEALSQHAAELPHISIEQPPAIMGRNTVDAMRAGVLYGNAAMVDSMIERLEEASAPAASVVITGGNGAMIRKYCKRDLIYDGNLLMDGLYLIYLKNMDRGRK